MEENSEQLFLNKTPFPKYYSTFFTHLHKYKVAWRLYASHERVKSMKNWKHGG